MNDEVTGTPTPNEPGAAAPAGTPSEVAPAPAATTETPAVAAEPGAPSEGLPTGEVSDAAHGAPETYNPFTLPEGYTLDESRNAEFSAFAKTKNWNQDTAQEAVDLYIKMQQEGQTAQDKAIADRKTEWETTTKNDEELGGVDFDKKMGISNKAVETFGNEAFKAALLESGLGSHPEFLRYSYKVGLTLSEDNPSNGNPPVNNTEQSTKQVLYPNETAKS